MESASVCSEALSKERRGWLGLGAMMSIGSVLTDPDWAADPWAVLAPSAETVLERRELRPRGLFAMR